MISFKIMIQHRQLIHHLTYSQGIISKTIIMQEQAFFHEQVKLEGDFQLCDICVYDELGRGNSHVYAITINNNEKNRQSLQTGQQYQYLRKQIKPQNQLYAMKQIEIKTDYHYQSFLKQISNLKELSQGNGYLIKYQGYFITEFKNYSKTKMAYIIMEYAQMNLGSFVSLKIQKNSNKLALFEIEKVVETLLKGFAQLQNMKVAHCDIKPQNVLVLNPKINNQILSPIKTSKKESFDVRICDVGSCKIVDSQSFQQATILGTIPFLAPELVQVKSKKIISANPFRSDVFSFGLVILYAITGKKFTSKSRKEIQPETYQEIINEWAKQAEQIVGSNQVHINQILKHSLQFEEHKRPLFKELKTLFDSFRRKKKIQTDNKIKSLFEKQIAKQKQQSTNCYGSYKEQTLANQLSSKNTTKYQTSVPATKQVRKQDRTTRVINGAQGKTFTLNGFKSVKSKHQLNSKFSASTLQKIKLKNESPSQSSGKNSKGSRKKKSKGQNNNNFIFRQTNNQMKTTLSSQFSLDRSKVSTYYNQASLNNQFQLETGKLIYVSETNKDFLPYENMRQEQKIFVLLTNFISNKLRNVQSVTIMPNIPLSIIHKMSEVSGQQLYLEYEGVETSGVDEDAPMLDFKKIHLNLSHSSIVSGYNNLLRTLCPIFLTHLTLKLTGSQITLSEIQQQLERLKNRDIKSLNLTYQESVLDQEEHSMILQKISKLPLKQLKLQLNSNYIKYSEPTRWQLPQNLTTLYLSYSNNFLGNIVHNLVLSVSQLKKLKQLYLNFQSNNLHDTEVKLLLRAFINFSGKTLEKLIMNISWNQVQKAKHAFEDFMAEKIQNKFNYLRELKSLELRIDHCGIPQQAFFNLFQGMVQLFRANEHNESKLKIIKLSIDRNITKQKLVDKLNHSILESDQSKTLRLNIVPYDNNFYMIYIEKKKIGPKNMVRIQQRNPRANLNPVKSPQIGSNKQNDEKICPRLYTSETSYESFICLSCIQTRKLAKAQYFCKTCIEGCSHRGHNIVRVYESKSCSCSYNFFCQNTGKINNQDYRATGQVCAQKLGIKYKKKYYCHKCVAHYCTACSSYCRQGHEEWVQVLGSAYFKCHSVYGENDQEQE